MRKLICILLIYLLFTAQCFAFVSNDLNIVSSQIPLSTQLKKYYNAYQYSLENKSQKQINIINAQIINGYDGNIAYTTTMNNEPSAMGRTWIIAGPVGLFTLGLGWIVGLMATPIVAIVSNKNKKNTQIESIPYTNMLPLGILNSGEITTVNTLVPIGSKPRLKLTILNPSNKQLEIINYEN